LLTSGILASLVLLLTGSPVSNWLHGGLAAILELKTWAAPRIEKRVEGLVVVGDSLSAGIKSGERTWPIELGSRLGVPVANRSRAGAHADSGIELLDAQTLNGQTVIILLGGNDMLSGADASNYEHHLDALVSAVETSGGLPILIQFPAIPARGAFPAAVAGVARRHGVPVIHRRLLASVLRMRGSTVDGLHLSESGHHALAEAMQKILSTRTRRSSS
jgi:acyl-CoA thioesterase-1